MNTPGTNWLNMADFDAAQRTAWYNMLFSIPITAGAKTPTLDALLRIGDVVEKGAGAVPGLPAHTDPFPTIASTGRPVTCTNNFHVLFTDGTTNQPTLPLVVGEVDGGNVPAASATVLPLIRVRAHPSGRSPRCTHWPARRGRVRMPTMRPRQPTRSPTSRFTTGCATCGQGQSLSTTSRPTTGRSGADLDPDAGPGSGGST